METTGVQQKNPGVSSIAESEESVVRRQRFLAITRATESLVSASERRDRAKAALFQSVFSRPSQLDSRLGEIALEWVHSMKLARESTSLILSLATTPFLLVPDRAEAPSSESASSTSVSSSPHLVAAPQTSSGTPGPRIERMAAQSARTFGGQQPLSALRERAQRRLPIASLGSSSLSASSTLSQPPSSLNPLLPRVPQNSISDSSSSFFPSAGLGKKRKPEIKQAQLDAQESRSAKKPNQLTNPGDDFFDELASLGDVEGELSI